MMDGELTMAERARYIGYAISGLTLAGTEDAAPPEKVTVAADVLRSFDTDVQSLADDLDEWSVQLHDRFRDLSMAFAELGKHLNYEVTVRAKSHG